MVVDEGITQKLHRNDGSRNMTFYAINATTGEEIWNTNKYAWLQSIAGGYLYLGDACFNATTGAKIWEYPTENVILQPIIAGDLVYINGYASKNDRSERIVYCLDAKTGTYMWNYTYTKTLLTVVDNHVFLWTTDLSNPDSDVNNIIALDVFTGNKIWNHTVGGSFHTEIVEDSVYIGSDNTVYLVDATTGAEKWNYQLEDYHVSGLVVANSSVYVSYGERLQCLDAATGDTKWTRTDVDVSYGLCCFGDEVYFGTAGERHRRGEYRDSDISTLYCLDAHTGTQIFNYTINGDPRDMVMVDDILYVGASYPFVYPVPETGYVYALKPTIEEVPVPSSSPPEEVPTPHSPSSLDTQQILIAVAGVSAILVVTYFAYKIIRKKK
jgi:outer membrane protein assembly factor BamB